MSKTIKTLLTVTLALFVTGTSYAQAIHSASDEKTGTFLFVPGNDMFFLKGNETELKRLYTLLDEYRTEITAGRLPVRVDGYCASLPTVKENLRTAFVRANRVKSELITHKGMKEADFITTNCACSYHNNKDMVVVTLRIPVKEIPKPQEAVEKASPEEEPTTEVASRQETKVEKAEKPVTHITSESTPVTSAKPYCFAVRTNILYDALLLPTLGVEWRINRHIGVKLDGSLAWWGNERNKVQKMWLLNPEARWYLLKDKRFYAGVSGNFGQYNIYKYAIGSILSKDNGYQGTMWGAGITVGYQLCLSRHFAVDFNLGLGYTRFDYNTFGITDGIRMYKERDCTKNFWGPTQAGISLVWRIGGNK